MMMKMVKHTLEIVWCSHRKIFETFNFFFRTLLRPHLTTRFLNYEFFFDFHDCFKNGGYYLKSNKESHLLQSLWDVFR